MSLPIDFYFDFSSPYGYLGAELIGDISSKHKRSVVWRPYLMGAVFKKLGSKPLVNVPLKGTYARRDIVRTAKYYDIPFSIPQSFPVNSVSACRAYYWIYDFDKEKAQRFALRIMRNYFCKNYDLSVLDNVLIAAEEEGLDKNEVEAAVNSQLIKDRLRSEVEAIMKKGIFGSPIFVVDGEVFWGSDRLDQLDKWLGGGGW